MDLTRLLKLNKQLKVLVPVLSLVLTFWLLQLEMSLIWYDFLNQWMKKYFKTKFMTFD